MFTREINPGLGRAGRVRPQLEILEDRCCPSGITLHNHVLSITADSTNNTILVQDHGQGSITAKITDGKGHTQTLNATAVNVIDINSSTGNDRIEYDLTNTLTNSETLNLNMGKGEDQVRLNFGQKISAKNLNINVDGGGGNPDVLATFGNIDGTNLKLAARLGNSSNNFDTKWDGGGQFYAKFTGSETDKANVSVNVQGGNGISNLNVLANSNIAAGAQMAITTAVGNGDNTIHTSYTGQLNGSLTIQDQTGSGWDWLDSEINITKGSTGSLTANLHGGSETDPLILMVNDSGSHLHSLNATISGGAGDRAIEHTSNVKVLNTK